MDKPNPSTNSGTLLNIIGSTDSLDNINGSPDISFMAEPWSDSDEDSEFSKQDNSKSEITPITTTTTANQFEQNLISKQKIDNRQKEIIPPPPKDIPMTSPSKESKLPPPPKDISMTSPSKETKLPPPPKELGYSLPSTTTTPMNGPPKDSFLNSTLYPLDSKKSSELLKLQATSSYTRGRKSRQKVGKYSNQPIGRFDAELEHPKSSGLSENKKEDHKSPIQIQSPLPSIQQTTIPSESPKETKPSEETPKETTTNPNPTTIEKKVSENTTQNSNIQGLDESNKETTTTEDKKEDNYATFEANSTLTNPYSVSLNETSSTGIEDNLQTNNNININTTDIQQQKQQQQQQQQEQQEKEQLTSPNSNLNNQYSPMNQQQQQQSVVTPSDQQYNSNIQQQYSTTSIESQYDSTTQQYSANVANQQYDSTTQQYNTTPVDPNYDPNAQQPYDPNAQQTYDPNAQQPYDPNAQQTYDPNAQQTYDPNTQQYTATTPVNQQYDPNTQQYTTAVANQQYDPNDPQYASYYAQYGYNCGYGYGYGYGYTDGSAKPEMVESSTMTVEEEKTENSQITPRENSVEKADQSVQTLKSTKDNSCETLKIEKSSIGLQTKEVVLKNSSVLTDPDQRRPIYRQKDRIPDGVRLPTTTIEYEFLKDDDYLFSPLSSKSLPATIISKSTESLEAHSNNVSTSMITDKNNKYICYIDGANIHVIQVEKQFKFVLGGHSSNVIHISLVTIENKYTRLLSVDEEGVIVVHEFDESKDLLDKDVTINDFCTVIMALKSVEYQIYCASFQPNNPNCFVVGTNQKCALYFNIEDQLWKRKISTINDSEDETESSDTLSSDSSSSDEELRKKKKERRRRRKEKKREKRRRKIIQKKEQEREDKLKLGIKAVKLEHGSNVKCLAFNTDGSVLATGGEDGLVRLWNMNDICDFQLPFFYYSPVRDSDDTKNIGSAKPITSLEFACYYPQYSIDSLLIVGSNKNRRIQVLDTFNLKVLHELNLGRKTVWKWDEKLKCLLAYKTNEAMLFSFHLCTPSILSSNKIKSPRKSSLKSESFELTQAFKFYCECPFNFDSVQFDYAIGWMLSKPIHSLTTMYGVGMGNSLNKDIKSKWYILYKHLSTLESCDISIKMVAPECRTACPLLGSLQWDIDEVWEETRVKREALEWEDLRLELEGDSKLEREKWEKEFNEKQNAWKEQTENIKKRFEAEKHSFLNDEIKAAVENELRIMCKPKVIADLNAELRGSLEDEIKSSLEDELREECKPQIIASLTEELRDSLEDQVKTTLERELRPLFEKELKIELRKELEEKLTEEVRASIEDKLRLECKEKVIKELQQLLEPEVKMNLERDIRQQYEPIIKENLKNELEDEVKLEVESKVKENILNEHGAEIKEEITNELRDSLKEEVRAKLEVEIREQVVDELREKLRDEVKISIEKQLREEYEPVIRAHMRKELHESLETEIRETMTSQIQAKIEEELREKLKGKIENETRGEYNQKRRSVIESEIRQTLSKSIANELEMKWREENEEQLRVRIETELRSSISQGIEMEKLAQEQKIQSEIEMERLAQEQKIQKEMEQKRAFLEQEMNKEIENKRVTIEQQLTDEIESKLRYSLEQQITSEIEAKRLTLEQSLNQEMENKHNSLHQGLDQEIETKRQVMEQTIRNELEIQIRASLEQEIRDQLYKTLRPEVEKQLQNEISNTIVTREVENSQNEDEVEKLKTENEKMEKEHEDLLICLYDMEEKVKSYRQKLRELSALSDSDTDSESDFDEEKSMDSINPEMTEVKPVENEIEKEETSMQSPLTTTLPFTQQQSPSINAPTSPFVQQQSPSINAPISPFTQQQSPSINAPISPFVQQQSPSINAPISPIVQQQQQQQQQPLSVAPTSPFVQQEVTTSQDQNIIPIISNKNQQADFFNFFSNLDQNSIPLFSNPNNETETEPFLSNLEQNQEQNQIFSPIQGAQPLIIKQEEKEIKNIVESQEKEIQFEQQQNQDILSGSEQKQIFSPKDTDQIEIPPPPKKPSAMESNKSPLFMTSAPSPLPSPTQKLPIQFNIPTTTHSMTNSPFENKSAQNKSPIPNTNEISFSPNLLGIKSIVAATDENKEKENKNESASIINPINLVDTTKPADTLASLQPIDGWDVEGTSWEISDFNDVSFSKETKAEFPTQNELINANETVTIEASKPAEIRDDLVAQQTFNNENQDQLSLILPPPQMNEKEINLDIIQGFTDTGNGWDIEFAQPSFDLPSQSTVLKDNTLEQPQQKSQQEAPKDTNSGLNDITFNTNIPLIPTTNENKNTDFDFNNTNIPLQSTNDDNNDWNIDGWDTNDDFIDFNTKPTTTTTTTTTNVTDNVTTNVTVTATPTITTTTTTTTTDTITNSINKEIKDTTSSLFAGKSNQLFGTEELTSKNDDFAGLGDWNNAGLEDANIPKVENVAKPKQNESSNDWDSLGLGNLSSIPKIESKDSEKPIENSNDWDNLGFGNISTIPKVEKEKQSKPTKDSNDWNINDWNSNDWNNNNNDWDLNFNNSSSSTVKKPSTINTTTQSTSNDNFWPNQKSGKNDNSSIKSYGSSKEGSMKFQSTGIGMSQKSPQSTSFGFGQRSPPSASLGFGAGQRSPPSASLGFGAGQRSPPSASLGFGAGQRSPPSASLGFGILKSPSSGFNNINQKASSSFGGIQKSPSLNMTNKFSFNRQPSFSSNTGGNSTTRSDMPSFGVAQSPSFTNKTADSPGLSKYFNEPSGGASSETQQPSFNNFFNSPQSTSSLFNKPQGPSSNFSMTRRHGKSEY